MVSIVSLSSRLPSKSACLHGAAEGGNLNADIDAVAVHAAIEAEGGGFRGGRIVFKNLRVEEELRPAGVVVGAEVVGNGIVEPVPVGLRLRLVDGFNAEGHHEVVAAVANCAAQKPFDARLAFRGAFRVIL